MSGLVPTALLVAAAGEKQVRTAELLTCAQLCGQVERDVGGVGYDMIQIQLLQMGCKRPYQQAGVCKLPCKSNLRFYGLNALS